MAIESDLITGDMVEVVEFPHLATRYEVMGVPRTVINETVHIEGAVPESVLMEEFAAVLE
jgi:predicted DsbA family dithiol-disulfide isomerase